MATVQRWLTARTMGLWVGMIGWLAAAGPLWAQDAGGEGEQAAEQGGDATSFAAAFFWSDSLVGLVVTWLLLVMSVVVIALVIHFLLQNRRENICPADAVEELDGLLADRKFRDAIEAAEQEPSAFGQIMHAALGEASNGYAAMERAVEETADMVATRRARGLEYLNVAGSVGPMIGLFGTVYGMIVAFQTIVDTGGNPSPEELAAGISTALVTTFWGLVVGIPAVAAAALIRNRMDALMTEAIVETEGLIGRFRSSGKKASGRSSSGKSGEGKSGESRPKPATPQPKPADS